MYSTDVTTEPHVVIYNTGKLVLGDFNNLRRNEWYWQSNKLYINVGEDPHIGTLEAAQRNQCLDIYNVKNVTVKEMTFESGNMPNFGNIYVDGTSSNITVSNCESRYSSGSGIFFGQNPGGNNIIQNCKFYGNERNGIDSWKHNSSFGSATVIKGNEIYANRNFGIRVHANYWIIEDNSIYNNGNINDSITGIWIGTVDRSDSFGEHNIVRHNIIYNQIGKMPDGSGITLDWDSNANLVYYNIIHHNDGPGIDVNDSTNHKIYNNICLCVFKWMWTNPV